MLYAPAARHGSKPMKSYKVVEFGQPLQKVEEANPAPQGTEVLVRVTAAGVCHSEAPLGRHLDLAAATIRPKDHGAPRPWGRDRREVVAVVLSSTGTNVVDRPVYPWIVGNCWYANRAATSCPTSRALGSHDGGYATNPLPHAKYPIPTAISVRARRLMCSITAFGAVKKAVGHDAGKPILVIGAGGVGLMGVRFAKSVLGREPIVADIDENKRKLALENGACAALDPRDKEARKQIMELTGGTGVGAASTCRAEAFANSACRALGRGGV